MIGKSAFCLAIFVGSLLGLSAGAVTTSKNIEIVVTHGPVALTTSTYVNNTGSMVPSGTPLLMAQPFRRGDVFADRNCAVPRNATTHNPLIWQRDNTATRRENGDDGSVRHWTFGVLTDASVPAGGDYTIEWVTTGIACPAQTAHQTLATLAAAHDLKLHFTSATNQDLTMRGSGSLTFDVNAAAANTGRDAPSKYAQGPVYDGWRIAGPPTWDTASSGRLIGAQLSPTQIGIGNWTGITNGSFHVVVDGTGHDVTGINLASAASLTDVATAINTRLTAASARATISWKPTDEISHFELFSNSTGTGSTVSLLTTAGSGTDISAQLLMTAGSTAYNSAINAYTAPGVTAGSKDPLLYVVCYVDVTTQADGTTMGKVRNVCTTYNGWLSVAAGTTGRPGNPGPAGYANDPQTINYRAALNDGTHTLIDFSAMFDATVDTSVTPIFINPPGGQQCSSQDFIPTCWVIPASTGTTPWIRGGAHVFTTTGTPPTCYYGAGLHGFVSPDPCQFSNGHLYFDFPGGTSGGQGLDSRYVGFTEIAGTGQNALVNPTSQGTGVVTWSSRIAHTHWMSWYTVAPDTSEPWSDGTSVSYAPWMPAFDQGAFTGERRYWEETGTMPPIRLTQSPVVNYDFLFDGNYYYQPMGRGPLTGTSTVGDRNELDILNQFAGAAWVTQSASDWFHSRGLSLSMAIYPFATFLHEATGRIPALNNGPPVPPGGGAGGTYGAMETAIDDGTHDFAYRAIGNPNNFGEAEPLEGVPINLTWKDDGTVHFYREANYAAAWWDDGSCCGSDHEPEFQGLNYLVFGQAYQLDNIYQLANNGNRVDKWQQLAGQPTYYAHFVGEDQVRGGWWRLRDQTRGAAFGDDSRDERTYFNDILHENYYAWKNWLAFIDGSTPNAYEQSIQAPGYPQWGVVFVDTYGTAAAFMAKAALNDPLGGSLSDQFARHWQAACGHSLADFPAYPPAFYCTTYNYYAAIKDGGANTNAFSTTPVQNSGFAYNIMNGQDWGNVQDGFGFTAGSGQVSIPLVAGVVQVEVGDLVRNYNPGFYGGTGPSVDQLDPTRQFTIIGPIDNVAHTFYIQCTSADHIAFPSQCPTAGAAFTGFTRGGVPLTDLNSGYGLVVHSQYDDGYTYDSTYINYVGQAIAELNVVGYDMSAALAQEATRFGVLNDSGHPSRILDATVVVP